MLSSGPCRSIILLFVMLIFVMANAWAGTGRVAPPYVDKAETITVAGYFDNLKAMDRQYLQAANNDGSGRDGIDLDAAEGHYDEIQGKKNSLKAFILSLAVPGAGQVYNGSYLKAVAFGGAEVALWCINIHYNNIGDEKTAIFRHYADSLWSEQRYQDYMNTNWGVTDDREVPLNDFSHHLPETKTQQYYEMIGKYDQFVFGWEDIDPLTNPDPTAHRTAISPERLYYVQMQGDTEKLYDRGRAAFIVAMINHLISATEAAITANRHNKNLESLAERLSVKASMRPVNEERVPTLTVSYKF